MNMNIKLKRVYEKPQKTDGFRILVDRLWPRGVSKQQAQIDLWLKEIAPNNKLRKWFNHDPGKWDDFVQRYEKEIQANPQKEKLAQIIKRYKVVTLLFGASDPKYNNAVALKKILKL